MSEEEKQVDWLEFPPVKEDYDVKKGFLKSEDERVRRAGESLCYEEGQILELRVQIQDPMLASIVLQSMYGGRLGIPGMTIQQVSQGSAAQKNYLRNWLQNELAKIDHT